MNVLKIIFVLGTFLACNFVYGQNVPVVAKVKFRFISESHVDLTLLEVYNGHLDNVLGIPRSIDLKNAPLTTTGEWLVTLKNDDGVWKLVSAYGLAPTTNLESSPKPLLPQSEISGQNARASMPPSAFQEEIVILVNQERWNNGMLRPLKQVEELHAAAQGHSEDMAMSNFFGHCNLQGEGIGDRMIDALYYFFTAAENIAAGNSTPEATMNQWMGSGGHRNNILSTSRYEIGVGHYYQSNDPSGIIGRNSDCTNNGESYSNLRHYWTQKFGRRSNIYPLVINREATITQQSQVDLYVYGSGFATEMRFRNESGSWSNWEPYTPDKTWTLSSGSGNKTVYAEIRNSMGTVRSYNDAIYFDSPEVVCPNPMIISNQTLAGTQTIEDCEIIADPNVDINGNVSFYAFKVGLGQDVNVMIGSVFTVMIQTE